MAVTLLGVLSYVIGLTRMVGLRTTKVTKACEKRERYMPHGSFSRFSRPFKPFAVQNVTRRLKS